MTFARDQDDVTRLRDFDGARDRLRAIADFLKMVAAKPFFDFGDDFVGIFFARIIRSDDGVIGLLVDNLTHQWPFLTVAIPAATEDDDHAPRPKLTQGF